MPNTREKLIELVTAYFGVDPSYYGIEAQHFADHLIANGVTIQEECHWATELAYKNGYEKGKQDAVKWIPLSEQKPDRDELVLVFFEGMRDTNCAIQVMYGWCLGGSASHWMPLPEPPKGE